MAILYLYPWETFDKNLQETPSSRTFRIFNLSHILSLLYNIQEPTSTYHALILTKNPRACHTYWSRTTLFLQYSTRVGFEFYFAIRTEYILEKCILSTRTNFEREMRLWYPILSKTIRSFMSGKSIHRWTNSCDFSDLGISKTHTDLEEQTPWLGKKKHTGSNWAKVDLKRREMKKPVHAKCERQQRLYLSKKWKKSTQDGSL